MRLIDADALMEALGITKECEDCQYEISIFCTKSQDFINACEAITDAPTIDAVEVVRCRDCTYAVKSKRVEKSCFPVFCAILEARMKDDDYCSQGDKND